MKAKNLFFTTAILLGLFLVSCQPEEARINQSTDAIMGTSGGGWGDDMPEAPLILAEDILIGECVEVYYDPGDPSEPTSSEPVNNEEPGSEVPSDDEAVVIDPGTIEPGGTISILPTCFNEVIVDLDNVTHGFFVGNLGMPLTYKFYKHSDQDAIEDFTFNSMASMPTFLVDDGETYAMIICSGGPCAVTYSNGTFSPVGGLSVSSPVYTVEVPDCCPWDDPVGPGNDDMPTD